MTILTCALVIYPPDLVLNFFELDIIGVPISFQTLMVLLALAHFFLANLVEVSVIINNVLNQFYINIHLSTLGIHRKLLVIQKT